MEDKVIAKIKKGMMSDTPNISCIVGCYLDENGDTKNTFRQSLSEFGPESIKNMFKTISKAISGQAGRNLTEVELSPNKKAYKAFNALLESDIKDEDALSWLFPAITKGLETEKSSGEEEEPTIEKPKNSIILIVKDVTDMSRKNSNPKDEGEILDEDEDFSGSTDFPHILCVVCPLKDEANIARYFNSEGKLRVSDIGLSMGTPEIGFMYPTFNDGAACKTSVLYHFKNENDPRENFVNYVFNSTAYPSPFSDIQENVGNVLKETLGDSANIGLYTDIKATIKNYENDARQAAKADNKRYKHVDMSAEDLVDIIRSSVKDESIKSSTYDGLTDQLSDVCEGLDAASFFSGNGLNIDVGEVKIRVPDGSERLVSSQVIKGKKYVTIEIVDEDAVLVNNVPVNV